MANTWSRWAGARSATLRKSEGSRFAAAAGRWQGVPPSDCSCGEREHHAGRGYGNRQMERATVSRQVLSIQRVRGEGLSTGRPGRLYVNALAGLVATASPEELGAIYAYLMSQPAVRHAVE